MSPYRRNCPPPPEPWTIGDYVRHVATACVALFVLTAAVGGTISACANPPSPAVVKSDLTTALDLTQAACSVADTTGVAYVILGCAITTVLENGAVQVANLFVPVSASQVSATLAAHPETEASKPLVLAWKALHPTAAVGPLPR